MKAITLHVSEPVYREYQQLAKKTDRKAAELIREAMELYLETKVRQKPTHSVVDIKPAGSGGKVLKPWKSRSELLEDFFDDRD